MPEFKTAFEIYEEYLEKTAVLTDKIKSGEVSEVDLLQAVVYARRAYIEAIRSAEIGARLGHEFDAEDELYKVRAIITGDAL